MSLWRLIFQRGKKIEETYWECEDDEYPSLARAKREARVPARRMERVVETKDDSKEEKQK